LTNSINYNSGITNLKPDSKAESINVRSVSQPNQNQWKKLSNISSNFEPGQKHDKLGCSFLTDRLRLKSGLSDRDLKYLASLSVAYSQNKNVDCSQPTEKYSNLVRN
jgi:hypothetical protein